MFKTVIWATDGSETAAHALPNAVELVSDGGTLVAAFVHELVVGRGGGYALYADEPDVLERLQEQIDELRTRGIDAKLVQRTCLSGRVGPMIAEIAASENADVIVVGTHGHTRLGQLIIGSVTQQLLRGGTYPVLAVPTVAVPATV